ncbi:MAG: peptidoglycan editing factor PgeF [Bacteroidales bacterium]|nr:peptidoglycan editing factor PgeF [Bacteroidales bacterium]
MEIQYFDNDDVCAFSSPLDASLATDAGAQNRQLLALRKGFDVAQLTSAEQVHGCNIAIVDSEHVGCGALDINTRIPATDALITNLRGVCLLILTADCVPVVLFDKRQKVIAAVHAGWRGTAQRIAEHTIDKMVSIFGTRPEDVVAAVGPHICGKCFEVGNEVVDAIGQEYVCGTGANGNPTLDLGAANIAQLKSVGVADIYDSGVCTYHCAEWPSWRREKSNVRLGTYIWLKRG